MTVAFVASYVSVEAAVVVGAVVGGAAAACDHLSLVSVADP